MDRPAGASRWMRVAVVVAALVAASCGGSGATGAPTGTPVAPGTAAAQPPTASGSGSGALDCTLLSAADFSAAGLAGAGSPSDNPDGTSHYCVYAGASGATGGIELDVFPHDSVSDAQATYQTVIGEGGAGQPVAGGSFDESSVSVVDKATFLAVRKGRLVLALAAPDGPATQAVLVGLANLAFQRAGAAAAP
jgi:hypothetical protein